MLLLNNQAKKSSEIKKQNKKQTKKNFSNNFNFSASRSVLLIKTHVINLSVDNYQGKDIIYLLFIYLVLNTYKNTMRFFG